VKAQYISCAGTRFGPVVDRTYRVHDQKNQQLVKTKDGSRTAAGGKS
jgi:hypothetical protein